MRCFAVLLLAAGPAFAGGEKAGKFDYYVLALSWSAAWCALTGDARGAEQCEARHNFTFTLHGLWPQDEAGWPGRCRSAEAPPSRGETRAMEDIMGSAGLAWHEWQVHGTCSGLSARDYFALSRQAYGKITIPEVLARVDRPLTVAPGVIEAALIEANPGLEPAMVTILCEGGRISEARICLTKGLEFRACGIDAARDCRADGAVLEPVR
ncbi:MAG: ribonuclease T2 family protein [Paracoccaceae bacterium]